MKLLISLCNFLHPPDTSSLLGPNILFSVLLPDSLNLGQIWCFHGDQDLSRGPVNFDTV